MTMIIGGIFGLLLAYANGANDNFKGVATLFGSGTASYRRSLVWATVTTAAGSVAAIVLAQSLLKAFSGKGLVPDDVVAMKSFAVAVAFAASATVLLATRLGFPISTTHALVGGLVGAGLVASSTGVNFTKLGSSFVLPLLLSPALAVGLAAVIYPLASVLRRSLGITRESCVCAGLEPVSAPARGCAESGMASMSAVADVPTIGVGTLTSCQERYQGRLMGVTAQSLVDMVHYLSAGVVSFARGLNDTPKIAAILLATGGLSGTWSVVAVGFVIALGGLLNARRVAETIAHKVTDMNPGQGLVANLLTGILVIMASRYGLPVSTTHVSCGTIFGIGAVTRKAHWRMIGTILLAWVTTLPIAAMLGALSFETIRIFAG